MQLKNNNIMKFFRTFIDFDDPSYPDFKPNFLDENLRNIQTKYYKEVVAF